MAPELLGSIRAYTPMSVIFSTELLWGFGHGSCVRHHSPLLCLCSLQVVFGASEELLPHPLCGMYGHRGPPGSLPPGVQQEKCNNILWGWHAGCGQLHARAAVHAEQWLEKETEDFGKVVFDLSLAQGAFFTADMLTCQCGKITGVTHSNYNRSVLFTCSSKLW